jgi:DNA-binding CsgD family transcriptional regulator
MASPVSTIEQLTSQQRQTVTDLLLAGKSCRLIGETLGISPFVVSRYKNRVIKPSIRVAAKVLAAERQQPIIHSQETAAIAAQAAAHVAREQAITREIAQSSPLRSRLDALWNRIDKYIEDPKVTDKAPLINQAHKNLELLGRATGELNDSNRINGSSMQIMQVLMLPVTPAPEPAKIVDAGATCDSDDSSS